MDLCQVGMEVNSLFRTAQGLREINPLQMMVSDLIEVIYKCREMVPVRNNGLVTSYGLKLCKLMFNCCCK